MRPLFLALSTLLLLPVAAHADNFTISVTVDGLSSTSTLTGDSIGNGGYLITGISGALLPGSSPASPIAVIGPNDPNYLNDNLFFPANHRLFDVSGLAFSGAFGSANLFSTVNGYEVQGYDAAGVYFDTTAQVAVVNTAAMPEPSSVVLSCTGLLALGAFAIRKHLVHPAAQTSML